MIMTLANHPAPMYVSAPNYAVPSKLAKDTVYMPSSVARRLLGPDAGASLADPSVAEPSEDGRE